MNRILKMQKMGGVLAGFISIFTLFMVSQLIPAYAETKWPDRFIFAAPSAGTTNYMIAVGMGEVIKKYTPVKAIQVLPLGGPAVWGPMMKKGDIDFAIQAGANVVDLFLGIGDFSKIGQIPVRTVIGGHTFPLMFHTTPEKNIKTLSDLKDKVVYTSMMGQPMFIQIASAQLASVGLTPKDLKSSSTMPSIAQATTDLIEGRVDAFIYPVVPSSVRQINQARGECVFINLTEKQADDVQENNPGYFKSIIPAGKFANKKEMRYAIAFQTCLHCRADLDPALIYEVVKTILDHHSEWVQTHPQAKDWGLDKNPVSIATEPYHVGAVKYYKEKGLWTNEVQQHNDKLMRRMK